MKFLFVHAHPDDETICNAITMSKLINLGHSVKVITFTNGENGQSWIETNNLSIQRSEEIKNALKKIGSIDHIFLGEYVDSFPYGQNLNPNSLANANIIDMAKMLIKIIIDYKPDCIFTYDEMGGSGHIDHIKVNNAVMLADSMMLEFPWKIKSIFWNALPKELNTNENYIKQYNFIDFYIKDKKLLQKKIDALSEYKSQIKIIEQDFMLPDKEIRPILDTEYYVVARGQNLTELL